MAGSPLGREDMKVAFAVAAAAAAVALIKPERVITKGVDAYCTVTRQGDDRPAPDDNVLDKLSKWGQNKLDRANVTLSVIDELEEFDSKSPIGHRTLVRAGMAVVTYKAAKGLLGLLLPNE